MDRKVPSLLQSYINTNLTTDHFSKATATNYVNDIMSFFKYLIMVRHEFSFLENVSDERILKELTDEDILSVTKEDVWGYALHIKEDRRNSPASVKRRVVALSGFYRFLRDDLDLLETVPTEGLKFENKEKKLPVFLTQEEWEHLLDTVKKHSRYRERDLCIIVFLLNLGLRRAEIEGLNVGDVKLTAGGGFVHIYGKGRKERNIPLNEACIAAYEACVRTRIHAATERDSAALFISSQGHRMTASSIYKMIKKMAKLAGLSPEVTTHSLRHTFGTNLIKVGSINQVQKLMGLESIATTTIYTHISDEGLEDMIKNNPANQSRQITFDTIERKEKQ